MPIAFLSATVLPFIALQRLRRELQCNRSYATVRCCKCFIMALLLDLSTELLYEVLIKLEYKSLKEFML
jgi:hypothetical protein